MSPGQGKAQNPCAPWGLLGPRGDLSAHPVNTHTRTQPGEPANSGNEDSEKGLHSRHLRRARRRTSVGGQDSSQGCVRHLQVISQTASAMVQPGSSS